MSDFGAGNPVAYSNKRVALHDISNSSSRPSIDEEKKQSVKEVKPDLRPRHSNNVNTNDSSPRGPFNFSDSNQTSSSRSWKDVDAPHADNPLECTIYVNDIYSHLRKIEGKSRPSDSYMENVQRDISHAMRGILVDWMVEVAEEYKLSSDTLFLTVNLIDRILSQYTCARSTLQLVGITCMLIAAKYEEIYAPNVDDFCYITDNTYARLQVLEMERKVLNMLGYNVGTPTVKTFARRYLRVAESTMDDRLDLLVCFLCELTLLEYTFLKFTPSQIAASAVLLANYQLGKPCWTNTLFHFTGYQPSYLQECVKVLYQVHVESMQSTQSLPAVREKYNNPNLRSIASYPIKGFNSSRMFQDIE
uniref:Cyclin N-terminal domain-containing protein n=1 Tax=Polyblepharides amylifera TaxID=1486889 RepID=A0A7R9XMB7_9CHLO|mmetsp:Transcript_980/g.1396  ORF Transcript_980/g.1396 Transcript_980/m.1396 type:complete len:361 (+) Transcript_980:2-1084(+)